MHEDYERISSQLQELKNAISKRGDERMFYTRMIYLVTVLSLVLAIVGLYMKTNAEMLERVDRRMGEVSGQYMSAGDGRRLEEKIEANAERSKRILDEVDRMRKEIADLAGDVKLIKDQVGRILKEKEG